MNRVYAPADGLATWKSRLADPEKQWVRTKSAFETAVFWELGARQPRGLHSRVTSLLDQEEALAQAQAIAAFPEHKVQLPGGNTASQSDVWAILKAPGGLVSLAVEGKAGESFADTVGEWRSKASDGKTKRLAFLCEQLGLVSGVDDLIRYQLLHRAASALIEAKRIGAASAVLLVVSFSDDAKSKNDFSEFASCLGSPFRAESLCRSVSTNTPFFLGWLDVPPCTDAELAVVDHGGNR